MRVLYVDDDRINALLFTETCRFAGNVEVETADSGAEALALAGRFRPDLLVIDLHLPDTCGYALLPALRWRCTAGRCRPTCAPPTKRRGGRPRRGSAAKPVFAGCWTLSRCDLQATRAGADLHAQRTGHRRPALPSARAGRHDESSAPNRPSATAKRRAPGCCWSTWARPMHPRLRRCAATWPNS